MTLPKKRTYDFRSSNGGILPEEQERSTCSYSRPKALVSDAVRKLILEEWPELAQSGAEAITPMMSGFENPPAWVALARHATRSPRPGKDGAVTGAAFVWINL
jgi:hypothetical protein